VNDRLARRLTDAIAGAARSGAVPSDMVCLHPGTPAVVLAALDAVTGGVAVAHRKLPELDAIAEAIPAADRAARVALHHTHGRVGLPAGLAADLVVVVVPPERVAAQQLVHDAAALLRVGGTLLLAGETEAGIRPVADFAGALFGNARVVAQAGGGRVVTCERTAAVDGSVVAHALAPYHDASAFRALSLTVAGVPVPVFTRPGVFSWDHLDDATGLLAEVMDVPTGARVLDLGCGAGVLAACVVRRVPSVEVTLVDADSEALRCAERTMAATGHRGWRVLASDVAGAVAGERFDVVLSNPPFHRGKATDLALPRRFIAEAHAVLRPGGTLQLVANRTLPYEAELARVFGHRRVLADGPRFKVLAAQRR
jgi:16S rRNA (guanine1207-N2)-methyltransferase